jgi:hypothetical protein
VSGYYGVMLTGITPGMVTLIGMLEEDWNKVDPF